ncbi:MAG: TetR/AcrR family transcriptional regulator [Bryobacteraceae bacterium]|nr:TetR/AcrR family transcriptional regulator [Bryobacteraceae bacterium]MDW8377010.1 TetR/AcrR family transcriptional regulator [Bryobacterales bacterium]
MSSDQRRAAIVQAAVRLFAQNGFRGTTTRQLAAALGVSEPVLYQHFQTKRELYSAILEHLSVGSRILLPEDLERLFKTSDDRTFFLRLATEILKWHLEDPSRPRILFYSALEGHELSELFYERHILPFHHALAAFIERGMQQGRFRQADPMLVAKSFCGTVAHYGLALTVFSHRDDEETRNRTIALIVDTFLNGVRKTEEPA